MSKGTAQMPLNWQGLDVRLTVKSAMAQALKDCGLSRDQVVDKINSLAAANGIVLRLTINTLDKWVAPSADHAIPYQLMPIFCRATGSMAPLGALATPLGAVVAGPREQWLMELGRAHLLAKQARREKQKALMALEDMS